MRAEVERFAEAMEAKLRRNDHKGGWAGCTRGYLRRRLRTELKEMFALLDELTRIEGKAMTSIADDARHVEVVSKLLGECVDVANFAMMVADTHDVLNRDRVKELAESK